MFALIAPNTGLAATFTVNSPADAVDNNIGDGICATIAAVCSLRAAVQEANASLAADDIISLPAGTYALAGAANENAAASGDLDILAAGGAVTITGAGALTTIIDGNNNDRIVQTQGAATVVISGVTLRNGNSGAQSGGAIATSNGANLTLNNVIMTNNTSGLEGGAIDIAANAASVVTMNTVVISNNSSGAAGDIVANGAGASLTITNGAINNNTETALSNKAGSTMTLTNVTVSGNTSTTSGGGHIDNEGTVNLNNSTIHLNAAQAGAGNAGGIRSIGTVNIRNTIISNNTPVNCVPTAAFNSQGNNLDSGTTCGLGGTGDVSSTDPLLNALADNGGPLRTHALQPASPAIDTGSLAATGLCATTDARGIARPVDGDTNGTATCDKGAFEFRPRNISPAPASVNFGTVLSGTTSDQVVTITNNGDGPLSLGAVAVTNPLAAPFTLPVDNCSNATLTRAQTCTLTVRFLPISTALASDSFTIPSDDPDTPAVTYAVSGAGSATLVPNLTITDSNNPADDLRVSFGGVAVGATADATITLTGGGSAAVVIGAIASVDPLAAPFSITNNTCSNAMLSPTQTCALTVRFAPVSNVSSSDTFDIPNNDPDTPTIIITLTGAGLSTTGNTPPSIPVLTSPLEGEVVAGTSVTLTWQRSSDADGNAVTYHVSNCTNPSFTGCTPVAVASAGPIGLALAGLGSLGAGLVVIGFVAGSGSRSSRKALLLMTAVLLAGAFFLSCSSGGGGGSAPPAASHAVTGLTPGTTYYWKVVADDGQGGTATSEVRSYRTQ